MKATGPSRPAARPAGRPWVGALAAALAGGLLALATGCTADGDESATAASSSPAETSSSAPASGSAGAASGAPAGTPVGPGCAGLPPEGPGSVAANAGLPAATAISQTPALGTLAQAVVTANLVDVLNTRQEVTVLAPADTAFAALGPDALPQLQADVPRLTALLTHHVVPGRLGLDELTGAHTTLLGDELTITGSGAEVQVAAEDTVAGAAPATLLCGPLQTANATVYVLDQVLAPAQ
ncbi:fasciclin domain-containing protein [Modestobacter roseus]|uniref:Putative surface protein with fasciclin (FAS1) repeats n=1 Tax=Modestobacter roseus TaxID=1181884 RepID=A0A562IV06_9ACTN|nr:fasciclin domain-containing protein [Modestobacter roseus]TWH74603.1 putative surface protein with fasciclin (FAS1) repeats [Modestobacter roseus]